MTSSVLADAALAVLRPSPFSQPSIFPSFAKPKDPHFPTSIIQVIRHLLSLTSSSPCLSTSVLTDSAASVGKSEQTCVRLRPVEWTRRTSRPASTFEIRSSMSDQSTASHLPSTSSLSSFMLFLSALSCALPPRSPMSTLWPSTTLSSRSTT